MNYELFFKRHEILGLQTKDHILNYKIFLQDEHSFTNLFNFQKLLKTDDYITKRVELNNINCQKVKNLSNSYTKINLLRIFEKVYNIDRLDFEFLNISLDNNLTKDEIELINNFTEAQRSIYQQRKMLFSYTLI